MYRYIDGYVYTYIFRSRALSLFLFLFLFLFLCTWEATKIIRLGGACFHKSSSYVVTLLGVVDAH